MAAGKTTFRARLTRPAALMAVTLSVLTASPQTDMAADHEVKAAFLLNFTRFIEWPPAVFSSASAPFVIGVVGGGEVENTLSVITRDKTLNGRPIEVRRVDARSARKCQLIFIPNAEMARAAEIVAAVAKAPVLVVGESEGFAQQGAAVNFVVRDRRVRFEINPDAAAESRLKISSKLLQLAILTGGRAWK